MCVFDVSDRKAWIFSRIEQLKDELTHRSSLRHLTQKFSSFLLKIKRFRLLVPQLLNSVSSPTLCVIVGKSLLCFSLKIFAKKLDEKLTQLTRRDPARFK